TIVFREPHAATKRAPQNNHLMSERGILSLKPDLRLEQRGQHGQDKPDEPDHRVPLADSSLNKPELGFRYTQEAGIDYQGRTHDEHTVGASGNAVTLSSAQAAFR